MSVDYFSSFATCCDSVINADCCLSNVANASSRCSTSEKTIVSERGDVSATESSDVPTMESGFSSDKSMTWFNYVISVNSDALIDYDRLSSEDYTAEDLIDVSKFEILVELHNGKVW